MAQPFKDQFNGATLDAYVAQLHGPGFDAAAFRQAASGLADLELKARVQRIADALAQSLPKPFPAAARLLKARSPASLPDASAVASTFAWWPLCTFVERHGTEHPTVSLELLKHLTTVFSAEFAVRPFLAADPQGVVAVLRGWTHDDNVHVRRWTSEGTRPRLPWGQQLRAFVADPSHTLPLLESLLDDDEAYVRRSVANHLGDIAKDHPDQAVAIASRWLTASAKRDDIVRHGLRHLIKQGHPGALALFGFRPPQVTASLRLKPPTVALGEALSVELTLCSTADAAQEIVVDLAIQFRGANNKLRAPKVFKGTTLTLAAGATTTWKRQQRLAVVTTRTHYAGEQQVWARVNGKDLASALFDLTVD